MTLTRERVGQMEREIATSLVEKALSMGLSLSVYNGGDDAEVEKQSDKDVILKAMFACDIDSILVFSQATDINPIGRFDLIYGNDGYNVLGDYTGGTRIEQIAQHLQPLIDKFCKEWEAS